MNWYCPNCPTTDVTGPVQNRFHACPALHGLLAPLVIEGTRAKVETHEREDYIGTEQVRLTNGRPVMSVVTTRDDGEDVIVFAPTATARVKE
jgi:hypothetical protein